MKARRSALGNPDKDFVMFAMALQAVIDYEARWQSARVIADVLASDNPRFDRTYFYQECGLRP